MCARYNTFGQIIKQHRTRCGVTQTSLASQLGVTRRTVNYWESGLKLPHGRHLSRLFAFLEFPLSDIQRTKHFLLGISLYTSLRMRGIHLH